jgi:hypothetical protein
MKKLLQSGRYLPHHTTFRRQTRLLSFLVECTLDYFLPACMVVLVQMNHDIYIGSTAVKSAVAFRNSFVCYLFLIARIARSALYNVMIDLLACRSIVMYSLSKMGHFVASICSIYFSTAIDTCSYPSGRSRRCRPLVSISTTVLSQRSRQTYYFPSTQPYAISG